MIDLINESYLQPFFTFYNVVEYSYGFQASYPRSSNLTSDNDGNSISPAETSANILQKNKPTDLKIQELFSQIDKSIVQISSEDETIGSGFVYDTNGHIITTHSIIPTAKDPHVTFSDGTIYTGKVIGSEPYSDLAVVLVNDVPKEKLFPLTLGNSSKLIIGERIAGVGNPFGLFGSLTEGIVTGLGRVIPLTLENIVGNDNGTVSFSIPDIIQTNAAINPGDYGGPLLNLNSEVIGINSAIYSNTGGFSGIGLAVPSNTIKKVIPELIEMGSYKHPWIGITGIDVTPDIAQKMNLTEARGLLVTDVNSGGPADKAGVRGGDKIDAIDGKEVELGGDVIIAIDEKPVRKIDDILSYLASQKSIGENISLTVIRDGSILEKSSILQARPDFESLALNSKGDALYNLGKYDEAIQSYDKALQIDPNSTYALNSKGDALYDLGRYDEAIQSYDKALQIDPNSTYALNNKGLALSDLEKYDEAIQYFDKALQIEPNYTLALNSKGDALYFLDKYDEAIQYYDKALEIELNDTDALDGKGDALYTLGRNDEAIQYYDKALQIDPNDTDALNNKGLALSDLEKYDEAIQYFDKALQIEPNYTLALNSKGDALYNLGKYDEAIQSYDKALQIDPNYTDALNSKGEALSALEKLR